MSSKRPGIWGSRNAALVALGLNVVVLAALVVSVLAIAVVPEGELADWLMSFSQTLAGLTALGTLIGALGFLPWLRTTYARARDATQSPEIEKHWQRGPVIGFFVPILNLVRPYQAVAALDRALDPNLVPHRGPRRVDTASTYREPAAVLVDDRRSVKPAPVGVWWGLWIGRALSGILLRLTPSASNAQIALHDLVPLAAATAACVVVWRIDARLVEYERRQAALREHEGP